MSNETEHSRNPKPDEHAARRPYTPPRATVVPLQAEERLLVCGKRGASLDPADNCQNLSAHS